MRCSSKLIPFFRAKQHYATYCLCQHKQPIPVPVATDNVVVYYKYAQKRHSCYLLNICNGFLFPCNYNVYISNGQYTIHTILHLAYLAYYKYNKTESVTYPCMQKLDYYNIILYRCHLFVSVAKST